MVVTVFLLFCTVLSFTWGPKCMLCVSIVIYQEFCEILWRVYVLVLLFSLAVFFLQFLHFLCPSSLPLVPILYPPLPVPPFFNSNWFPVITQSTSWIWQNEEGEGDKKKSKSKPLTYYWGKKKEITVVKVAALISVCRNFQGNGRLNTGAGSRSGCRRSVRVPLKSIFIEKKNYWKGKCLGLLMICIEKSRVHKELWGLNGPVLNGIHWSIRNQVVGSIYLSECVVVWAV